MNLESGKIPNSQLFFLILGLAMGANIILSPGGMAGKDAWLAVFVGFVEGLVFIVIQQALIMRFPGKTLVEFMDIIYGKSLGKLIAAAYLFYFIQVSSYVLRTFNDFWVDAVYPETPVIAIGVSLILLCVMAVKNGIEVIGRSSIILVMFFLVSTTIATILTIKDMNINNLLPIMDTSVQKFFSSSHTMATFPFGELIVFSMIIPYTNDIREAKKWIIPSAIVACVILSIISFRNIAVLGGNALISTYPSFTVLSEINYANILARLEILVSLNLIGTAFLKLCVYFYSVTLGVGQLFGLRSYQSLTMIMGIMIIAFSFYVFDSTNSIFYYANNIWPYYSLIFQLLIPLLTLITAVIRKLPEREVSK